MMNSPYTLLTLESLNHIARGSVSFSQHLRDGGIGYRVGYPNGYSASIIKLPYSYGNEDDLWEVAVLWNDSLCYDTPITDDVCGYLTEEEVIAVCDQIYRL